MGLGELDPQPYWGFDDLAHDAGAKLHNAFFIEAETKVVDGVSCYRYVRAMMLSTFSFEALLAAIEAGWAYVDFDARTGHNHGTKFRVRSHLLPRLYASAAEIDLAARTEVPPTAQHWNSTAVGRSQKRSSTALSPAGLRAPKSMSAPERSSAATAGFYTYCGSRKHSIDWSQMMRLGRLTCAT